MLTLTPFISHSFISRREYSTITTILKESPSFDKSFQISTGLNRFDEIQSKERDKGRVRNWRYDRNQISVLLWITGISTERCQRMHVKTQIVIFLCHLTLLGRRKTKCGKCHSDLSSSLSRLRLFNFIINIRKKISR